jgi:RNA polymerase sigma-70 factor (ECF subfamily)
MTEEQFTALFEQHHGAVLGYALRRVDPDTARDVTAETFLVAWRRLGDAAPAHPRSWFLAVARRVLANELRRQGRAERLVHRIGQHLPGEGSGDDSGVLPVAVALEGLSARDREVLILIGWDQLDQREAAAVLGCTVTALKVRLHRARKRLEAALRLDVPAPQEVER